MSSLPEALINKALATSPHPRRSYLFVPGNALKRLDKALRSGADAVVFDLEDAVPEKEKQNARAMVAEVLRRAVPSPGAPQMWVRLNGAERDFVEDVRAVVCPVLHGVRLSKAERVEDVIAIDEELKRAETAMGRAQNSIAVALTIESALGLDQVRRLAAGPRVRHLCFGATDFARDLGIETGLDEDEMELLLAKQGLVLASRLANIEPPVASAYTKLDDPDGLGRTTRLARRLGFFGRSCIHPNQLAVVHETFTPDREAVEKAEAIMVAWNEAIARGCAATTAPGGVFIDRAVMRRAEQVLLLAQAFGGPNASAPFGDNLERKDA